MSPTTRMFKLAARDLWQFRSVVSWKNTHFDRDVIPEERMHAKGPVLKLAPFTLTNDITEVRASMTPEVGKRFNVWWDYNRSEGAWVRPMPSATYAVLQWSFTPTKAIGILWVITLRCFSAWPVGKFPDLNHAIKRDPRTGMRNPLQTGISGHCLLKQLHQITDTMSPRGIPASDCNMHGFGSHTAASSIRTISAHGWGFHFITLQGVKNLTDKKPRP